MSEEQLLEMQREWREEVRENFRELKELIGDQEKRLRELEDCKTKAIGAVSVIQMIGMAALWVVNHVSSK